MTNTTSGNQPFAKPSQPNGIVNKAALSAHEAVDKTAGVAGSAVQSVNTAIDQATASGHQVIKSVEDKVRPAEQWINEKTEAFLAAPKNAVSDARQYIVTHPWQSLGIAIIAGVLLGYKKR